MPGFTEAVLCWLPAKTAIEAVSKVEEGYVLSESELVLLRERVGRREHTPSHLAAVAASASGLAIIEERLAGGFLLNNQLTDFSFRPEIDGRPVKFEIVREARIDLDPPDARLCGCPVLSTADQYAEKLLANADRGADKAVAWRDAIDLGMLIQHLGPVPDAAVTKAVGAYGPSVLAALSRVHETLDLPDNRRHARDRLGMTGEDLDRAVDALGTDLRRLTGG